VPDDISSHLNQPARPVLPFQLARAPNTECATAASGSKSIPGKSVPPAQNHISLLKKPVPARAKPFQPAQNQFQPPPSQFTPSSESISAGKNPFNCACADPSKDIPNLFQPPPRPRLRHRQWNSCRTQYDTSAPTPQPLQPSR